MGIKQKKATKKTDGERIEKTQKKGGKAKTNMNIKRKNETKTEGGK